MAFLRTAEVLVQLGAEQTDATETWRDEAAGALRRHLDPGAVELGGFSWGKVHLIAFNSI